MGSHSAATISMSRLLPGAKDPAVLCLSVQAGGLVGGRPRKGNMYNSS